MQGGGSGPRLALPCTAQKQPGVSSVLGGNSMSGQASTALQPPGAGLLMDTLCARLPPSGPPHGMLTLGVPSPCYLSNAEGFDRIATTFY